MVLDVVLRKEGVDLVLAEGGGVEVRRLLQVAEALEEGRLAADPGPPETGSEDFGEGAEDHHLALCVHGLQGGGRGSLEPEFAVGVVLHHEDVVL